MSDQMSEAEKIRIKRLAKLGGASQTSSQESSQADPSQGSSQAAPGTPPQSAPRAPRQDAAASRAQNSVTSTATPSITPPAASSSPKPSTQINITPASSGITTPRQPESVEAFEDRTLSAIFRVTLKEDQKTDVHGQKLVYIPGVRQELEEQGQPVRMSIGVLEQALLEAASNLGKTNPLEYLLPCWKRVSRLRKGFRKPHEDDPKFIIAREARRLCMSYCIFAATMPEMFGIDAPTSSPLKPHFLVDPDCDRGIDHEFMSEAMKRMEEDDMIKTAFTDTIEEMSRDLRNMTMNDDYKGYVAALRNIVRFPAMAAAITESPSFLDEQPANTFETHTLLGPWFRLSPMQGPVTSSYFSDPKSRDAGFITTSQRSLRMVQQLHNEDLLDVVNHIIRAAKEARERMLDWFATAININHKRKAMQVDPKTVSSDGFMFNLTTCLDQLCEPFMDGAFTKIDRIDATYLHRNPRVKMNDETKLNADQQTSDEFYGRKADGTSNFITELFFLTVAAHHYGSESLTSKIDQLEKDLRHMEQQINKFELERHKWVSNPVQLRTFDEALKKYKDRYDHGLSFKYTLQAVLLDTNWQTRSMQFMRYVIVWLLRVASGRNFPTQSIDLPLPEQQSEVFRCLPEYFLEDIGDELVILCITFLQASDYIKNPYLKSGLVTILFRGTWPWRNGAKGVLVELLNSMPFATKYLLHALMKFYIEAEFTGTHTQFFDKFNIRFEIFQIIKCIWPNPVYRENLLREAEKNLDFFVRFVNLLLNDVTFVLDESFGAFVTIHDTQLELSQAGNLMNETARQEKEEQLAAAQGRAKSFMQLTNETVSMLKLFTEALAESFTMPEIVQRLADMLDYNLDSMVGPRSTNLKVDNLSEYGFNPRALLSDLVDVYINLMEKENFIIAVARDGRSYKPVNFEKAAEILKKWALKSTNTLALWDKLQQKFKSAKEADEQDEEDLGEIPDEFLDPLIYTLMEDPVKLPSSRMTIDRATIRSHLLSDPNDPFNRAPLKIEDVIPDTEIKAKIEAFKAEKRAARLAATGPRSGEATDAAAMDTSAG